MAEALNAQDYYIKYAEEIADRLAGPEKGDEIADYRGFTEIKWAIIAEDYMARAESMSMEGSANSAEMSALERVVVEAKVRSKWLWWPEECPEPTPFYASHVPRRFGGLAVASSAVRAA